MSESGWRALYPFASHWLDVDSHRLHYLDEGPRDAPVLLMLHGNPTWSFYFRNLVVALRDRYRVIVPDHLGCGLSDKPQDWSYRLAGHVDNVERLVAHLRVASLTLVVHDWGGAIGFGLAARGLDRISRLVIFNTAAFPAPRIPTRIAICRTPGLGPLLVRGLNGFARAATFMATERGLPREVRAGYLAPYSSWRDRIAVLRFVQDIPMGPSHTSWPALAAAESAIAALRGRPALIVWGERDWCFTPAFRGEWQRRLPDARVRAIADAGHYVLEDAREEVVSSVREFLLETAGDSAPAPATRASAPDIAAPSRQG